MLVLERKCWTKKNQLKKLEKELPMSLEQKKEKASWKQREQCGTEHHPKWSGSLCTAVLENSRRVISRIFFFKHHGQLTFINTMVLFLCRPLVRGSCYVIFISLIIICTWFRHAIVTGQPHCYHFLAPPPSTLLWRCWLEVGSSCEPCDQQISSIWAPSKSKRGEVERLHIKCFRPVVNCNNNILEHSLAIGQRCSMQELTEDKWSIFSFVHKQQK